MALQEPLSLVADTRRRISECLEQVIRMDERRVAKGSFEKKTYGRTWKGRD